MPKDILRGSLLSSSLLPQLLTASSTAGQAKVPAGGTVHVGEQVRGGGGPGGHQVGGVARPPKNFQGMGNLTWPHVD